MKYAKHPDSELAATLEHILMERLVESLSMSPAKLYKHNEETAKMLLDYLPELTQPGEAIVYTNINPMEKLFRDGEHAMLLKASKTRLPLCGDGLFSRPGRRLFPAPLSSRPSREMSIIERGNQSPFLAATTARQAELFSKCFEYSTSHEFDYNALIARIADNDFNLDGVKVWAGYAADESLIVKALIQSSGLDVMQNVSEDLADTAIAQWCEDIQGNAIRMAKIRSLFDLYHDKRTATATFIHSCFDRSSIQDGAYMARTGQNLTTQIRVFETLYPSETQYLRGYMLALSTTAYTPGLSMDYVGTFKNLYTPEQLDGHIRPSHAQKLVKQYLMTELIDKTPEKFIRERISEDLGL